MAAALAFAEKFRDQVLRCSKCGFCQAVCPIFGLTLRPALNARGKMLVLKEVMEGSIKLSDELVETLFQCTTCGHCAHTCPSGVNVAEIIKEVRQDMVRAGSGHPAFTSLNKALAAQTNIYAEDSPEEFDRERNKKAPNVFFIGCVGAFREEEATRATLDLLDRLEVDYTLVDEVCCSGVLADVGHQPQARLAKANIEKILASGAKTLITACPYCYRTFINRPEYQELRDKALEIVHLSQFLSQREIPASTDKLVTYHDPCDLGRHCGIYQEPRLVINKIAKNFVELEHSRDQSLCCGAGGGVRGAYPDNSVAMARRRLEEVERVGAEVLLTDCNSCLHNLANAKLRRQRFEIYTTPQFIGQLLKEAE